MKKTKIFIIFLLSICLFSFSTILATDANANLEINKTTVKPGDTISVTLKADCSTGLSYIGTSIEYDKEVLTLENTTVASNWTNYGTDKLELFVNTSDKITTVNACTLVFKVNDSAKAGKTAISTTDIEIMDIENNEYKKTKLEKSITIEGKEGKEEKEEEEEKPNQITLVSISIEKQPNKTKYNAGEKFEKDGMKVVAKYSDGTSKEITNYTYSPDKELTVEDNKITIKYTEDGITKEVELSIKVVKKEQEENKQEENKQEENKQEENKQEENKQEENKQEENKQEENKQEENKQEENKQEENKQEENKQEENKQEENKQDNTTSKTSIPQTGTREFVIVIGIATCVVISIIFFLKVQNTKI